MASCVVAGAGGFSGGPNRARHGHMACPRPAQASGSAPPRQGNGPE
jgi:hypothetical protein